MMQCTAVNRGQAAYHAGLAAESSVARDYESRGYSLLDRRWRGAGGEIDLIAQDAEGLVFIEVKKSRSFAAAAERLNTRQMQRICLSAQDYLDGRGFGQLTNMRFDVALVDGGGAMRIVENAFGEAEAALIIIEPIALLRHVSSPNDGESRHEDRLSDGPDRGRGY